MTTGFSRSELLCLERLSAVLLPEGHRLPGAQRTYLTARLQARAETWQPKVRIRFRALVRAFEWSPVLSKHHRRFSKLAEKDRAPWVQASLRTRHPLRRLTAMGVKQLVLLAWASTPEVEAALEFDYHCWRDDQPHGTERGATEARPTEVPDAPEDLVRQGPATRSGAVPLRLVTRTTSPGIPPAPPLETIEWPDIDHGFRTRAEVVVVGSGAGGAVVAATLAERGIDVVVVEEGPNVEAESDFTGAVFDRFQRLYRDNGTTLVLGRPPIPLPLGRAVGGTTVVNAGTCFRAPDRVLARWESEYGLSGVAGGGLDAQYDALEDALHVRPVPWELLGPNAMAVHRGATALGMSGGPLLRNIGDCHGCGQCVFGCPTNAKQAMHLSYLPRAARAGARIFSRCRVERVLLEEGRAVGVSASVGDGSGRRGEIEIRADHVVVCAGAIHTPALLQGSGVKDPSGQTGRNLRVHPASGVSGVMEDAARYWQGTLQSYYIDELFDSHEVMFEATTAVPGVGAGSLPGIGTEAMDDLALFGRLATLGFYVSDTSKGRVRRLPGGDVVATYRMNALDARRFSVGVATAAEVLFAAGATKVYPGVAGIDAVADLEALRELKERGVRPERLRLSAFHPMGTVRAGADPERSVVDPWGRHHATENLWVADASAFPSCVGVNPQMTIMALAKRSAEALADTIGGAGRWTQVHTGWV
jgi:choline dehydrogenase-like flavoprotein